MPSLKRQWRSLAELANDPSFLARAASDRRRVLKLMAAAFAMRGLTGCDLGAPSGHLMPAVKAPPNIVPGRANFYSTANVVDDIGIL
jgi:hypothetical protein